MLTIVGVSTVGKNQFDQLRVASLDGIAQSIFGVWLCLEKVWSLHKHPPGVCSHAETNGSEEVQVGAALLKQHTQHSQLLFTKGTCSKKERCVPIPATALQVNIIREESTNGFWCSHFDGQEQGSPAKAITSVDVRPMINQ